MGPEGIRQKKRDKKWGRASKQAGDEDRTGISGETEICKTLRGGRWVTIREKLREIKSATLQWRCLPDGRTASETRSTCISMMLKLGDLCQTIFVTFQNRKSDIHALFGSDWPGEKARQHLKLSLKISFIYSLHNYFCHFSYVQMTATLRMPSRTDCLKIWDEIIVPYPWWPLNVAFQNSYNHFCLQTWLANMSYKQIRFEHILNLRPLKISVQNLL